MAHISTVLDSPAVVSLTDGELLAEGGRVLYRVLYKDAPPWGPTPYPFLNALWQKQKPLSNTFH